MNTEFKILLRKGSVFILPIIAWICIVVAIDPFNYFNLTKIISQQSKEKSAQKLNCQIIAFCSSGKMKQF